MAPPHAFRPENVLKRAEDLISVGQPDAALETLYELITSKKTRSVAPASLEPIALLFIELSVDLRKGKIAKDGLHQYKKNVQLAPSGLQSVETVVRKFIELSEKKLGAAQAKADVAIDEDEDLEEGNESPEAILLSAVSNDDSNDRTERELVNPWLRFLWEAYRAVLDILRNNAKLEVSYAAIVNQAFQFCLKFGRKTEFRRLCELLRTHIQTASQQKGGLQTNAIDLADPETLQRYLDLRFAQLNIAVKLELWQESFRSVEDVYSLLNNSKRQPKPTMMVNYYENLARIFAVSDNHLFHAAAWQKFYSLYSQSPNVTDAELSKFGGLFLLSSLSIPYTVNTPESADESRNRNAKLSALLNLTKTPTRASLIESALGKKVLSFIDPAIKQLYEVLEKDSHPLTIKQKLSTVFKAIESSNDLKSYIKPLTQVVLVKLFQQVSQVYETVRLDFLVRLATFEGAFLLTPIEIEYFLINASRDGHLSLVIDHDSQVVTFKSNPFDDSVAFESTGNCLQSISSEVIRVQLSNLTNALVHSSKVIDPAYEQKKKLAQEQAIKSLIANIIEEQKEIALRPQLLEAHKRTLEEEKRKKDEEASKLRAEREIAEKKAEEERLEQEVIRRRDEKIQREKDAIREKEKKQLAEEINAKGIIKIDVDKLEDLDADKLKIMQVEQLAKDKKDLEDRLKSLSRRLDHTERAFRKYELPHLAKDAELQKERDIAAHEEYSAKILANSKKDHEKALVLRDRLVRIVPDYSVFRSKIQQQKAAELSNLIEQNKQKLEQEKQRRITQVKQEKINELKRQKMAEQREKEEDERTSRLEKERAEQAKLRAEEEERLAEEARKEREAELAKKPLTFAERQRLKREQASSGVASGSSSPAPVSTPIRSIPPPSSVPAPAPIRSSPSISTPPPSSSSPAPSTPLSFAEKMRLRRQQGN